MNQTPHIAVVGATGAVGIEMIDRKSTRLNSSHSQISYAVFCLKKKHLCSRPRRFRLRDLNPQPLGEKPAPRSHPPFIVSASARIYDTVALLPANVMTPRGQNFG